MTRDMGFGQAAGLFHRTVPAEGKSETDIQASIEEVITFAEAGGLSVRVERDGRDVVYHFDNYADYLIVNQEFNPEVNGPDRLSDFVLVQRFEARDQAYQDTWTYHARQYLEDLGVKYHLDEYGDGAVFHFENVTAFTTFKAFRDAGMFDRQTEVRIADRGPVAPGALPY